MSAALPTLRPPRRLPWPSRLTALQTVSLLLAALVNVAVMPRLLAGAAVDLVLLVVVTAALRAGPLSGALVGLAGGWLVDLIPPGTPVLGLTGLLYAAVGACIGAGRGWADHSPLSPALAVLAASVFLQTMAVVADLVAGRAVGWGDAAGSVLLTTLVGACVVPPLLHLQRRLVRGGRA